MKYFWFTFKDILFMFWAMFLNAYFYARYYFYAFKGNFNSDYSSERVKEGFELSFEDEFNTEEIDWVKWNQWWSDGNGCDSTQTAAISSLDCIRLNESYVHLTTVKNDDPATMDEFPCKSGHLVSMYDTGCENWEKTSKGYQQNYGYFETRCKVPAKGKLFWPSFWLWGNTWPPEIDIFEFMSTEDIHTEHTKGISHTIHWGYDGKKNSSWLFGSQLGRTYRRLFGISVNWNENFHVFACNWTPHYIDWYIDDIKVYRGIYNIPSSQMSITIGIGAYVDQPPTDTDLPGELIVDYVRAYKII